MNIGGLSVAYCADWPLLPFAPEPRPASRTFAIAADAAARSANGPARKSVRIEPSACLRRSVYAGTPAAFNFAAQFRALASSGNTPSCTANRAPGGEAGEPVSFPASVLGSALAVWALLLAWLFAALLAALFVALFATCAALL